jgi:hypothetical protein
MYLFTDISGWAWCETIVDALKFAASRKIDKFSLLEYKNNTWREVRIDFV